MDAPDLAPATYAAVLADLARVNRVTLAARPTIAFLERALARRQNFRLLDVGFGQGDMLRTIAAWAARTGRHAQLVGIDLNPSSAPVARQMTDPALPIRYETGDYRELAGEPFDLVISSLVAHHMTHDEIVAFIRFMEKEARSGWHINDLHRHRLAYSGYPVLARLLRCHWIVREDGRLSIARAFRPADWPPILAAAGLNPAIPEVRRFFPFRLCVTRIR